MLEVQILDGAEIWFKISAPPAPLASSAMMNTLTVHCQWETEPVRERTGHPPSCAEAKKMKSLTHHTLGCPRVFLLDCYCSLNMAIILTIFYRFLCESYFNFVDHCVNGFLA